MRGFASLLLALPLVYPTHLLADLEGARYMSDQHAPNAVPRIGRRASVEENNNALGQYIPQYPYPHFLKEKQSWENVGKRGSSYKSQLPATLRLDLARLGKRGPPTFSIPDHWKSPSKRTALSALREHLYPQMLKRSAQQDPWTGSWSHQVRGPQGFRLHDGEFDYLSRNILYKRAEDSGRDLNSVPFIGKRTEESKAQRLENDEILVRVPREPLNPNKDEDNNDINPWDYINANSKTKTMLMM